MKQATLEFHALHMPCQEKVKTGFFTSQKIVFVLHILLCYIYILKLLYSQDCLPVKRLFFYFGHPVVFYIYINTTV